MSTCCASNCNSDTRNLKGKNKSFHRFPVSKPELLKQWLTNIDRPGWKPSSNSRICSDHFTTEMFDRTGQTIRLRDNAVPVIFGNRRCAVYVSTKDQSEDEFQNLSTKLDVVSQAEDDETIEGESTSKSNEVWHTDELSETDLLNEVMDISDRQIGAPKKRAYCDQDAQQPLEKPISAEEMMNIQERLANEVQASTSVELRQALHQFQKDGYLCDTVLIGEDGQVKAHSSVLAAASNVFRMSLKSREPPVEQVIVIPGVELDLLEIAVHFAYTGEIAIPSDSVSAAQLSRIINLLMELELIVSSQESRDDEEVSEFPASSSSGGVDICAFGLSNSEERGRNTVNTCVPDLDISDSVSLVMDNGSSIPLDTVEPTRLAYNGCSADELDSSFNIERRSSMNHLLKLDDLGVLVESMSSATKKGSKKSVRKSKISLATGITDEQSCDVISKNKHSNPASTVKIQGNKTDELGQQSTLSAFGKLCEICGQVFLNEHRLRCHKRRHGIHPRGRVYCTQCSISCSNMANLRRHMMQHTGERPHLCQHCGDSFFQRQSMIDHVSSHHPEVVDTDPSIISRQCPDCGLRFYNSSRFRNHTMSGCKQYSKKNARPRKKDFEGGGDQNSESKEDDYLSRKYACKLCSKRFRLQASLIVHGRVHEKLYPQQYVPPSCKQDENSGVGKLNPFACRTCDKQLHSRHSLVLHERLHTGEKPFICPQCHWKARSQTALFLHVLIHTGELPYACKKCGKAFRMKASLRCHEQVHHSNSVDDSKALYESTVVGEDGQIVFVCKICMKSFPSRAALLTHSRIHRPPQKESDDGEKPFVCTVCDKRVRLNVHLKAHMRMHTGEKPFGCRLCSKAYKSNTDLRLHYRNVHHLELKKRPGRRPTDDDSHELLSLDPMAFSQPEDLTEDAIITTLRIKS